MRKYPEYHNSPGTTTLVYGLDADLIMLTLNHLHITKNLYLFRETPEFIKSVDSTLDPNKDYLLDIPELADSIIKYINNTEATMVVSTGGDTGARDFSKLKEKGEKRDNEINRITDYIFMCFLLGNDFMPHFPALNIRTVGIDILLNVYKETLGKTDKYLTEGNKIVWKNFHDFIDNIAKQEDTLLMDEHKKRDKFARRIGDGDHNSNHNNMRDNRGERNAFNRDLNKNQQMSQTFSKNDKKVLRETEEVLGEGADIQKMDDLLMLPMKERSIEKYINPFVKDWEYRYYKALFDIEVTDDRRKQICINYLEGLEWVFKYYTGVCPDWKWKYNYHYCNYRNYYFDNMLNYAWYSYHQSH